MVLSQIHEKWNILNHRKGRNDEGKKFTFIQYLKQSMCQKSGMWLIKPDCLTVQFAITVEFYLRLLLAQIVLICYSDFSLRLAARQ